MARAAGTSVSTSSGVAVGTDTRGNVGVAGYGGSTVNQTEVARSLSVGSASAKRAQFEHNLASYVIFGGIPLIVFIAGVFNGLQGFHFFALLAFSGVAYHFYRARKNLPTLEDVRGEGQVQAMIDRSWLCNRCGKIWRDEEHL